MGDWYRVVKTIKGHQYVYEQQTYRDKGRVRTRNRYLGPASGGGSGAGGVSSGDSATVTTTTARRRGGTSFAKAFFDQLGGLDVWGQAALTQLGVSDAKVRAVTTTRRRHKHKAFLKEMDGRMYFLIVEEGNEDERLSQTAPANEVWLLPDI